MHAGKGNIVVGLIGLAGFMAYGFMLIYLRDFAPGKEQWIADYAIGKHFESRLAHVRPDQHRSWPRAGAVSVASGDWARDCLARNCRNANADRHPLRGAVFGAAGFGAAGRFFDACLHAVACRRRLASFRAEMKGKRRQDHAVGLDDGSSPRLPGLYLATAWIVNPSEFR